MSDALSEIQNQAERASLLFQERGLDFSEASLEVVAELLAEAAVDLDDRSTEQLSALVELFGCYILEVGRRQYGGEYFWLEDRHEPLLVVGEPTTHIAIASWGKVRGRLNGDESDNIPFFYKGFADYARRRPPRKRIVFV